MRETTVGEMVKEHGNALLVGASGESVVIVGGSLLVGRDGSPNVLDRATAANLAAWLIMVGRLGRADLDPVFEAQGVPPPWASEKC